MGNGDGRKKEQIKSYYMLRTLHMTIEIAMFIHHFHTPGIHSSDSYEYCLFRYEECQRGHC